MKIYKRTDFIRFTVPVPTWQAGQVWGVIPGVVKIDTVPEGIWAIEWEIVYPRGVTTWAQFKLQFLELPHPQIDDIALIGPTQQIYEAIPSGRSIVRGPAEVYMGQSSFNYYGGNLGTFSDLTGAYRYTAWRLDDPRDNALPQLSLTTERQLYLLVSIVHATTAYIIPWGTAPLTWVPTMMRVDTARWDAAAPNDGTNKLLLYRNPFTNWIAPAGSDVILDYRPGMSAYLEFRNGNPGIRYALQNTSAAFDVHDVMLTLERTP